MPDKWLCENLSRRSFCRLRNSKRAGEYGRYGSPFGSQRSWSEGPLKYSGNGLKAFNTVIVVLKRSAIPLTEDAIDSAALEKAIGKRILRKCNIDSRTYFKTGRFAKPPNLGTNFDTGCLVLVRMC